jgi:hypothetical protein
MFVYAQILPTTTIGVVELLQTIKTSEIKQFAKFLVFLILV